MIVLVIDASTYVGTAAVIADGRVLASGDAEMRGATEERLMPLVERVVREAGLESVAALDAVACGGGPGSFTSLRIAASIAKGIAAGADIPLLAIPSLALLAAAGGERSVPVAATMNALRGEWYVAIFERSPDGDLVQASDTVVTSSEAAHRLVAERGARLVGELAGDGLRPEARFAVEAGLAQAGAVSLADWEPAYGRLAEAQVRWEAAHGRPLDTR